DVVILAVEQLDLEVHHGTAGQDAAECGLLDAAVHRRNELSRNRAADDLVGESVPGAAWPRHHPDPAVPELATPTALLLVLAFPFGAAFDGLAVGDLRL